MATTTGSFKGTIGGLFKVKFDGLAAAAIITIAVLVVILNIGISIFLVWVVAHNVMLLVAGAGAFWNVVFITIAALMLINIATHDA